MAKIVRLLCQSLVDGQVAENFGYVKIPILIGNTSLSSKNIPDIRTTTIATELAAYINNPNDIYGVVTAEYAHVGEVAAYINSSRVLDIVGIPAGVTFKFTDEKSGYYAITEPKIATSLATMNSIWALYDNNNNVIASRISTNSFCPAINDTYFVNIIVPELDGNGNIPNGSTCRYLELRLSASSTDYSVRARISGSSTMNSDLITWFNALSSYIDPTIPTDPYSPGGHSGSGGGTGKFSRTGDTVGEHNVPTLSAVDAGFITLFAPTAGEMKSLASYLWSDLFSIDTFKKIFANPMDAILGLSIVPVAVPTGGSASVKVGNISTGVSMTKASTQYVKLSCGSLEVEEYWGAYLDYAPYTKCEIYLPYIGIHQLSIDDVMGKTVKVIYYIDILSGACTAEIYSNNTCLYSFVGQCSASIPITGNDWTNVINGVMQIGASIGAMVASGGLSAPVSAGGVASGLKSVASASSTVTASKPSVERSGSMSGAGGMLGQQTPYLIITWPKECIPAEQNKQIGYPSFVTVNLGDIGGFNSIESVHLENIPATSAELDEIETLLMNGVIF